MICKTRLTLDLKDSQSYDTLIFHRGDSNSRVIEIELTDNHAPVTLTPAMSATVDASTNGIVVADGEKAIVDTANNIISFTVTDNMTSLPGQSKISLTVTEGNAVITAQTFRAIVAESIINEGSKFEPTGGTVQQIIIQMLKGLEDKADKATTLAGYGITDAYTKSLSDMLFGCHSSITFDENYIPLTFINSTALHPGDFATENEKIKYVYISSTVTAIDSGTFAGCTNLNKVFYGGCDKETESFNKTIITDAPSVREFVNMRRSEITDFLVRAIKSINETKVSDKSKINSTELNYPSIKYLDDYYYDFEETNDLLSEKYDASNVETGVGSLSVYTQSAIDNELVKSCTFDYQKTGKIVNIFFEIVFNAGSINYLQFTGLPFKGNSMSDQNRYVSVTNKNTQATTYPVGSWLALNFGTAKTFVQDEALKGVVTIQIS